MARKSVQDAAAPPVTLPALPVSETVELQGVLSGDEIVARGIIVDGVPTKVASALSYGPDPAGYTIRLDTVFQYNTDSALGPLNCPGEWKTFIERDVLRLSPGALVLGRGMEVFAVPSGILGLGALKTSYTRCGLQCTIPQLDPGWSGYLTLCIVNPTGHSIDIYPGRGFAQVSFFRVAGEATYVGNYQGTVAPTPSRG